MTISSISSSNYYMGQLSAMRSRATSAEKSTALEANRPEGPPPGGMMGGMRGMQGSPPPDFSDMFSNADQDENGSLDETEAQSLADLISQATGEEMDAADLISAYDEDGDGVLSQEETQTALEANRPEGPPPGGMMGGMGGMQGGPPPDFAEMFSNADQDENGSLDETEAQSLADIISQATGEEMDAADLISAYDEDEDGVLSQEETQAAMEANRPQGPPPPPQGAMATETDETQSSLSAGLKNYLKMAALGSDQDQATSLFAMFAGKADSDSDTTLFSVNMRV